MVIIIVSYLRNVGDMVFNVNYLIYNYKLNGEIKLFIREDKINKNVMDMLYCWILVELFLVKNKVEFC